MALSRPEFALADFAAGLRLEDIPETVRHEAKRSLLNVFATMLAGCGESAVDITLRTLQETGGAPTAGLVGRPERVDAATAAFVNAMSANIFDFDDTHEPTIIHPAAIPCASLFAQAETTGRSGADLLTAFVAGGEVECRVGNAVSPDHYARGWHITSTCGVFGAAAGVGSLLALDGGRMLHAFSAAAVQSSGLVEMLGTMAKSISVGGAARGGLLAARLADAGLTGPPPSADRRTRLPQGVRRCAASRRADRGPRHALGDRDQHVQAVSDRGRPEPGARRDTRFRRRRPDVWTMSRRWRSPAIRSFASGRTVRMSATGREGQVSAQHAITIALLDGCAGLDQFTDAAAERTLAAPRPRVTFHDEAGRDIASADVVLHLKGGGERRVSVAAARGSRTNPLSDAGARRQARRLRARRWLWRRCGCACGGALDHRDGARCRRHHAPRGE